MELVDRLNSVEAANAHAELSHLIDWDEVLRFLAVDWYIGDLDGFSGGVGTNNFYLYRAASDGKWRLLPWDKDATFIDKDHPLWRLDETGIENRWLFLVRNNPELKEKFVAYCRLAADEGSGWLIEQADLFREISNEEALADSRRPWDIVTYETALEEFFYYLRERPASAGEAMSKEEPGGTQP